MAFFSLNLLMKNLIYFLLPLLIIGCKKQKEKEKEVEPVTTELAAGLPQNSKEINGYLRSGYRVSNYMSTFYEVALFAFFGDPKRNLMASFDRLNSTTFFTGFSSLPNISVNDVSFNDKLLFGSNQGSAFSYFKSPESISQTFSVTPSLQSNWNIQGNGSFEGFNITIPRSYPALTSTTSLPTSITKSNGCSIALGGLILNADSIIVSIRDSNFNKVVKRFGSNVNSITFSSAELSSMSQFGSGVLSIYFSNYSNKTIKDKVYVFEQSGQYELYNITFN